jgi:hypothetical protein
MREALSGLVFLIDNTPPKKRKGFLLEALSPAELI